MRAQSYGRKNVKNLMPIIIKRTEAKPSGMISLEDSETHYLVKTPANAARLCDAINEIESMIPERKF
jgi:hypothetical protein